MPRARPPATRRRARHKREIEFARLFHGETRLKTAGRPSADPLRRKQHALLHSFNDVSRYCAIHAAACCIALSAIGSTCTMFKNPWGSCFTIFSLQSVLLTPRKRKKRQTHQLMTFRAPKPARFVPPPTFPPRASGAQTSRNRPAAGPATPSPPTPAAAL